MDITSTARNSLAKSLLYYLRNHLHGRIKLCVDSVRNRLFEILRSQWQLLAVVDVATDLHEWRFYGSASTDRVITMYLDLGTNRAFCFATLCIVAPRTRFTLAVLPMNENSFRDNREAVRSIVKTVCEYISIRHVYLDRCFYQVHVVAALEQLAINHIVRARPSKGMKDRLSAENETVADDYTMRQKDTSTASADTTVFTLPHQSNEDEHVWFITNLDVNVSTAKAYAAAFRCRWGIETLYRQIGNFLPKISSPTFSVRLFYFLFAVSLYNLWVLSNVLVSDRTLPQKPPVSTRIFCRFVLSTEYG